MFNAPGCVAGINALQRRLSPIRLSEGTIVRPELYVSVLGNEKYDDGLRLAAESLRLRIEKKFFSGDIFSDLKGAFRRSGLSSADSVEYTWNVLGLIATGGPNLSLRLEQVLAFSDGGQPIPQNAAALIFISVAMEVLDSFKAQANKNLYSYPSTLVARCDNAKPYHFWMAAFDARELVARDKLSEAAALSASFISVKAYQAVRSQLNGGGELFSGVLSSATYSPASEIIRTDLAYGAAGSKFGATLGDARRSSAIDVGKILGAVLRNSSVLSPISSAEQEHMSLPSQYFRWDEIFSPDTAYRYVRDQN